MTHCRILPSVFLAALTVLQACAQSKVDLVGPDGLKGWTIRGGKATYDVQGKEIVGRCVLNSENTFLCTDRTFGDFVLEYDFKVDPRLNSGVQIRSECFDRATQVEWRGKTIDVPARRVHGYQIEIDPDPKQDRWWSAGVYDEGRRGWLYPGQLGGENKAFTDAGRMLFKQGSWNHVRVEAVGDSIKTWLNGKPCALIRDSMTLRGFIALQVHTIGNDATKLGAEVRWRNLQLTDLTPRDNTLSKREKAEGWKLLWDGKSTSGWRGAKLKTFPARGWETKDGVLSVMPTGGQEAAAGGDIVTVARYGDFELLVDFRITEGANSGIKVFCQPDLDPVTGTGAKAGTGSAIGLEFQILDDERHPDAKLGRDGNRTLGSLYDLMPASDFKRPNPIGEWNTARIVSKRGHVEHWLNGRKILEYDRTSAAFKEAVSLSKFKSVPGFGAWADGHILLQDHGDRVSFKNIKIRTPH